MDKVDFGKPKPTASAGTYKPAEPPKMRIFVDETPKSEKTKPNPKIKIRELPPAEVKKFEAKIDERARAQIKAEKDARTNETEKFKLKLKATIPGAIIGTMIGGVGGVAVAGTVPTILACDEAVSHDQGKMTDVEETIYRENLYGRRSDKTWAEKRADEKFDEGNQRLIDERKEEIKAEEEDEDE